MLITILPHKYNEMSFISNIYFRSATKISLVSTATIKHMRVFRATGYMYQNNILNT